MTDIETTENVFEAKARALVEAEREIFLPIGEIDRLISAIASALEAERHDSDAELSSARERVAELEASLRAALKSHDKIPVNIPLPSWVENARSTLEGKQDA